MTVIDADAHVLETADTWSYMSAAETARFLPMIVTQSFGNRNLNLEGRTHQEFWVIDKRIHNKDRNVGSNTPEESREMRDVAARVAHMDELGVDVQVLYPTLLLRPVARQWELEYALCRSYNRWLADIWAQAPDRLRWAAAAPLLNMDLVEAELAWAKDHGACGVFLRGLECELPLSDPYFHRLYAIAQDLDLAVCIHLGNGSFTAHDFFERDSTFTKFKLAIVGAFHSLVLTGTPGKFPNLRWGFIEAGTDWVPFVLHDLRHRLHRTGKRLPDHPLRAMNLFVACQVNDDLGQVLAEAGEDHIVLGTDYGHSDFSSELHAPEVLRRTLTADPAIVDKILGDNARVLYGLD